VQVSPDKYHKTGMMVPGACGGTKTEKVMSVDVLVDAWR
jgi:hypothetical protein